MQEAEKRILKEIFSKPELRATNSNTLLLPYLLSMETLSLEQAGNFRMGDLPYSLH